MLWQTDRYAVDLPFSDDYGFVQQIAGLEPVNLAWLWEAHNEHRMVLPKLVLTFVTRAAGMDFRATAHVSALLVCLAAFACVFTIARLRGRWAIEDALVPLVVCTWSQAEALTWTSPLNLVATTVALLLWWTAAHRSLTAAIVAAVALALTGASGITAMVGVVPWFVWTAWRSKRVAPALCAAGLVGYCVLYAVTYTPLAGHPGPKSVGQVARYVARLAASPFSSIGDLQDVLGIGVLLAAAWLTWRTRRRFTPTHALLLAACATCGAVALGRAGFSGLTIASRYVTLMIPLAVALLALFAIADPPRPAVAALAAIIVVSLGYNDKVGHNAGHWLQKRLNAARTDITNGKPLSEVVATHGLYPDPAYGVTGLCALAKARGSVFRESASADCQP